jgi:hypothetical protein
LAEVTHREKRVHSSHDVKVTLKNSIHDVSCRENLCGKTVVRPQEIECADAGHQFLAGGRTHALIGIQGIQGDIVCEVIYVESQLSRLEQRDVAEGIQSILQLSQPSASIASSNERHVLACIRGLLNLLDRGLGSLWFRRDNLSRFLLLNELLIILICESPPTTAGGEEQSPYEKGREKAI